MDWLAATCELLGVWMIGNKSRWGFALCLGCNAAWIYVSVTTGVYGLGAISVLMAAVNVRNFNRWSKEVACERK